MASRQPAETSSPSASSLLLPLGLRSRRGSLASLSSRTLVDKDTLSQALDHVHSSARGTDSLTSFNDFAAPPASASPADDRGLAGQLVHGGLGGIYNRLRSTVASTRETTEPAPRPHSSASGRSQLAKDHRPLTPSTLGNFPSVPVLQKPASETGADSPPSLQKKVGASVTHHEDKRHSGYESPALSFDPNAKKNANVSSQVSHISTNNLPSDKVSSKDNSFLEKERESLSVNPKIETEKSNQFMRETGFDSGLEPRISRSSASPKLNPTNGRNTTTGHNGLRQNKPSKKDEFISTAPQLPRPDFSRKKESYDLEAELPGFHMTRTLSSEASQATPAHSPFPREPQRTESNLPLYGELPASPKDSRSSSIVLIDQMRRKVLSRDFWMKDENAKVCFNCGEGFSTFRRKHHCRLCGQIYCSSCTNLISGKPFGQTSKLRVCHTCEVMINGADSSDSDYSDIEDVMAASQLKQIRFSEVTNEHVHQRGQESFHDHLTRQPTLTRTGSSRSLKSMNGRPRSSSQKHRRSKHQHMRSLGTGTDGSAPFHHDFQHQQSRDTTLPSFHTDSILDPDLMPFMSDEGSSDEEPASIAANLSGDVPDQTGVGFNGLLSAIKKGRPKALSVRGLDPDHDNKEIDTHITGSRISGHIRRPMGSRTISLGIPGRHGNSPRVIRSKNLFTDFNTQDSPLRQSGSIDTPLSAFDEYPKYFPKPVQGLSTAPAAELNKASLDHVKNLLKQFLEDKQVEHSKSWEKALLPILLQCAENVDPNIHRGDDIDIRHYVKLKRAAGGHPKDSSYVSGVVFSKNVALKNMPRNIKNPRILLLSFPLVYLRHQQHFMSLEPVIAQEREYLRNLVNRILALKPQVLLVQRNISGLALDFLQEAKIAVVYNVKDSVLQALSRCTQTRIISSVEKLHMSPDALGSCSSFDVRTFVYKGVKKSYIFISGCQNDLGCTIVLRGAAPKMLAKLKWITEFMCYVVYNLKLETCLLRDQFVSIPTSTVYAGAVESGQESSKKRDNIGNERNLVATEDENHGSLDHEAENHKNHRDEESRAQRSYGEMVRELERRILSISPFVKLADPYLLLRGQKEEQQMEHLRQLQIEDDQNHESLESEKVSESFELVEPQMIYGDAKSASPRIREVLRAIHSAEYEKALHRYTTLRRRWDTYISGVIDPFSPLAHQRIVVLYSIISTPSGDACEGPDLLGLDFYHEHDIDKTMDPDVPLGEYVERLCEQAEFPCTAERCERKMTDHHRQYVHGDGQISIFVEKQSSMIRGLEHTILMWSCCRLCDHETQVVPMSRDSWKYSFGKYLELSFWSQPMRPRAGNCPHDIHRDHKRYFGFRNLAVRLQYDPINILDVMVPRLRVAWNVEKDLRLKNDQYLRIEARLSRFISSVKMRIKGINLSSVTPEKTTSCKAEIESLLKRAHDEYEYVLAKAREKYMTSKYYEVIPMNRAVRALQEKVAEWDDVFAEFEKNYFPSEKDIRRLAALQLKKAYLDDDTTTGNVQATEDQHELKEFDDEKSTIISLQSPQESPRLTRTNSPELGKASGSFEIELSTIKHEDGVESTPANNTVVSIPLQAREKQTVQNLDLALPGESSSVITSPVSFHRNSIDDHSSANATPVEPTPLNPELVAKVEQMPQKTGQPVGRDGEVSQTPSSIPKPVQRKRFRPTSPTLIRSKTQPAVFQRTPVLQEPDSNATSNDVPTPNTLLYRNDHTNQSGVIQSNEKRMPGFTGVGLRSKSAFSSMIPRPAAARNHSKVSSLAKHFEKLSREFEKERRRERQQRTERNRQRTFYPMAASKPIVEVFKDAHEAVREPDPSITDYRYDSLGELALEEQLHDDPTSQDIVEDLEEDEGEAQVPNERENESVDDTTEREVVTADPSYPGSMLEGIDSDVDVQDSRDSLGTFVDRNPLSPIESPLDFPIDLPKHEKSSLLSMLTSFWSERSASGWTSLEYPLVPTDHIFTDSDVIVREDEPSSLVAFSLESPDYIAKLEKFRERAKAEEFERQVALGLNSKQGDDIEVENILLGRTATHLKYVFQDGPARMQCKVFFAESFDAIRRKCGVADRFVESLSRCLKWDSKGGKTKSLFLKTLDERFVLKSLSPVETTAFLKFAPDYFDYMSKCLFHNLPSALAKMLGFYQVVIKNPVTGVEYSYFLQVMENVFYEGPSNRMFDLKGSMRNRKIQSTGESDEVLLDENLLDYISQAPIYVRSHSNSILASSISNDTLFCSKQNVMDYSLIVGLYDDRKELLVGIIDYIRTYTWDKKLEWWIKDRGKHKPTVLSPKDYRNRFRASIPRYFPLAPSCWQPYGQQRGEYHHALWNIGEADLDEGHGSGGAIRVEEVREIAKQDAD